MHLLAVSSAIVVVLIDDRCILYALSDHIALCDELRTLYFDVFTPHPHTPDIISLHCPDLLAEIPQKFDPSKFVPHSPRNEFEAVCQISVTPTSVLANFDVSTSYPHTLNMCYLPSFNNTTNALNPPLNIHSMVKATSNILGFEWVCLSSEVDRDKKQIAPPVAVQRGHILQVITIAISPRVTSEVQASSLFNGPGEPCHEQLTND